MILSDSLVYHQENGEQQTCWKNQNWCLSGLLLLCCAQSCPTLRDPMDRSPLGSSVHGIFQARILERVAIFFSNGISQPRDQTHISWVSCIGKWILHHYATWKAHIRGRQSFWWCWLRIGCYWLPSFHSPFILFSPGFNWVLSTRISCTSGESSPSPHSQRWTLACAHSSIPWTLWLASVPGKHLLGASEKEASPPLFFLWLFVFSQRLSWRSSLFSVD